MPVPSYRHHRSMIRILRARERSRKLSPVVSRSLMILTTTLQFSFPRCPTRRAPALIFLRTPPIGESVEEDQGILSVGCSATASSQGTPALAVPANLKGRYRRAVELGGAMTPRACTLPLRVTREDHETYLRVSEMDPDVAKRLPPTAMTRGSYSPSGRS